MKRRNFLKGASLAMAAAFGMLGAGAAQAAYPDRPITMIVPWGAGGGTDAVGRIFASLLEKELGVPVNVVNRTGGSGVVGHSAIATAKPDGYTIGIATVEIAMMHWAGLTELTYEDYTVLGQVNLDPGGLMVAKGSPYQTAADLLAAIKKEPEGTFKGSGTGQGGIWHLGFAGWMLSEGVDPAVAPWIPSQGSAPALKDMVAGGTDFVTSSLAEGRALIDAGEVVPLANMGEERLAIFPDVPTLKEATGSDWVVGAWRMVVGPKGLPEEVTSVLIPALEKAYNSPEYKEFMDGRGFGMVWRPADEAKAFMQKSDTDFGEVMKKAGLTK
ncbi:tripartite tricarboxylate transporter substrate binding protein [Microbaculum marinum]|uniref:Tripartite tricarboxylate transporter substrate binding protein n=1 Tax=Microbaculum marinum TaxID=1764581 RepID=A0AAW9RQY5_9HYPH